MDEILIPFISRGSSPWGFEGDLKPEGFKFFPLKVSPNNKEMNLNPNVLSSILFFLTKQPLNDSI